MAKTTSERIEGLNEQIRQLENHRKKLVQEHKEQARRARTKRLIERGAILESLIDEAGTLTNDQIKTFLKKVLQTADAKKALANLKAPKAEKPAEKEAPMSTPPESE